MPISITITADDAAELRGWAQLLAGTMAPVEVGGVVEMTAAAATVIQKAVGAAEDAPRRGRKPKETSDPAPAAPPAETPPVEGEVIAPETPTLTLDDLRVEMKRISADHGLEATRKLLEKFGTARVGDLEPAKFAEFVKVAKTWTGAGA